MISMEESLDLVPENRANFLEQSLRHIHEKELLLQKVQHFYQNEDV